MKRGRWWARPWWHASPRWPVLVVLATVLVLGLSMMVGATVMGLITGLREAERLHRDAAEYRYRQGLMYLRAGQRELALAEFREALRLNPQHVRAQRQIIALVLATPTPVPTPTPTPIPTPSVDPNLPWQLMLRAAQEDMAAERWQTAYMRLEQLHTLAPDFQPENVRGLLYEAAYQEGITLLGEDRLEEALRAFDRALRWRPNDPKARRQRDLTEAYILGISYFYADWDNAITIFERLYRQAPDFKDVAARYQEALLQGAAYHLRRGAPCRAQMYYQRLREIAPERVPLDLATQAASACAGS